jgi:hypothetical protein
VFVAGVVAPFAAVLIYGLVYSLMTSLSRDVEKDWGFRLIVAAVAMTVPGIWTFVLGLSPIQAAEAIHVVHSRTGPRACY